MRLRRGILLVSIGMLVGGVAVWGAGRWFHSSHAPDKVSEKKKVTYYCPMHPTVTSDHPGDCPICGMKLVPRDDKKQDEYFTTEGHPGNTHAQHGQHAQVAGTVGVEGLATVTIDPVRQQLIGLRTAPVTRGKISATWRTVGRVEVDPTRVKKNQRESRGIRGARLRRFRRQTRA